MNHPYPDNYHGGYPRGGPAGMQHQSMGYGHGGYDNPAAMARMGHLRHGYNPIPQQYVDGNGGPMHPMMQHHPQHPGGGMYSPHAGYMGQMGGGAHYGGMGPAGNYPGYNSMPGGMAHSHPGMSQHSMGQSRGQHHPGNNMMDGSGAGYYNNHPHPSPHHHPHQQHHQQGSTNQIAHQQQPTPPPNYGHQSPSGNSSVPKSTSVPYGQQAPPQPQPQPNQNNTSQATHHHHPTPHNTNNMQASSNTNCSSSSAAASSLPPTTTQTYNMPITTQAAISNNNSNSSHAQVQQQQQIAVSSQNNGSSMMMPNSHSQAAPTYAHAQPRPPVTGSVSAMATGGGGTGGSSHSIPQHPMRHPTTQQSPQEVADNILQIASSYPTNQTVQVPLKGQSRHAPYHIPRSPHHFNSSSSPSTSTSTTSSSLPLDNFAPAADSTAVAASNHFLQQHPVVASPPVASSSQQSQPNMSPSTSSGVKSPNPALAPIPNPIPSPGISGIRSPSSSHCLSPCGSQQQQQQQQRSPSQMASSLSSYSGHNQPSPSPLSSQHYSPISGGGTPQHHSSAYVHSPPSYHPSSNNQANLSQSTADNQSMFGSYSNMNYNTHHPHHHPQSSSPYAGNMTSPNHSSMPGSGQYNHHHHHQQQQCMGNDGNNPLMSLQKLVMLPETQVVDPKSVVNDACLAASANESNVNADSKNCEGPAERFAESSGLSVGSSGQFSSLSNDGCQLNDDVKSQAITSTDTQGNPNSEATANDVVDGEVKDVKDCEEDGHLLSNENATVMMQGGKVSPFRNESDVLDNMLSSETEKLLHDQEDSKFLTLNSDSLNKFEVKKENDSVSNLQDQFPSSELVSLNHCPSENIAKNTVENFLVDEVKVEKVTNDDDVTPLSNSLGKDESLKPLIHALEKSDSIISEVPEGKRVLDEDGTIKESENSSHMKNKDSVSPVKQEDEAQYDLKETSPETKSPTVLAEVQVVMNGNHSASVTEEEEDKEELAEDRECLKVTRSRLRNGLMSVVRSKIGKTAKKASQFLRLTTPCSIAVGADEREVCEQFAFRRNGYCHALRASRLLYNGRGRQDSTSHGDSDESIENISDTSFHSLGTPQDGSKKKNTSRKNDASQSNSSEQAKTTGKEPVVSKRSSSVSSNVKDSNLGGAADSHENKELSDEDGGICYYEGVDNTDFFIVNNSSDDSFSSSPDTKQKKQEGNSSSSGHGEDNEKGKDSDKKDDSSSAILTPPVKRVRRVPAQRKIEVSSGQTDIKTEDDPVPSRVIENGMESVNNIHSKEVKELNPPTSKLDENSSDRENGKVPKTRLHRRKQVFGKLLVPEEQMKLPEVLVKLEKSEKVLKTSKSIDVIDLTDDLQPKDETSSISGSTETSETLREGTNSKIIAGKHDVPQAVKVQGVKPQDQESEIPNISQNSPPKLKGTPTKRKRPTSKKKTKGVDSGVSNKDEDVRDSFKSMKFGRTLDMMKSQRKKEQNAIGPFIRVIGNRVMPKKVSVINQSVQNQTAVTSGKQNQKSSMKQSVTSSAAISILSNVSSDKTAFVTSSKTVSQQTWVCAFCNHQSSFHSLGDLFGPYYCENDIPKVEHIAMEEAKKAKDNDKRPDKKGQCWPSPSTSKCDKKSQAKAEKRGKVTPKADKMSLPSSASKKRKLSGKKVDCPQEVWVHQACALWAPGVYVIGSKLYGMDEAMKDAADSICSSCKTKGAMVGCLHKGCAMKYHVSCAMDQDCFLDEENLSLLCPKHKDKKLRISSASASSLPLS